MKEKIIDKVTSAKFLISMLVISTTCYLVIANKMPSDQFVPLATMIVGFYFGQSVARK